MSQIYKGYHHEDRYFLVTYKPLIDSNNQESTESPKLLCKSCYENPNFVNDSVVDVVFNLETGEEL